MNVPLPQLDFAVIFPQLVLSITAIVVLMLGLVVPRRNHGFLGIIGLAGIILCMLNISHRSSLDASVSFNRMAIMDGTSFVFTTLFLLSTAFVIVLSIPFLDKSRISGGEYYSLILFATVGMILMATTTDLIIIFLGLELMSISLYILATITRRDSRSNEAAMKYLLLGAFATGFLLYGIAFIYGSTGSTNLTVIMERFKTLPPIAHDWMLMAGVLLLIVGLGFKIGLVPFHAWIPDVYEGAPTVVTAFMSIGPKAAAFASLVRILLNGPFIPLPRYMIVDWPLLLAGLAGLTMTLGNLVAMAQSNIKRMLAYSSIAHAGYVMLAIITARNTATPSIAFYFFAYLFMNLGAFAVVYAVQKSEGEGNTIKSFAGLGHKKPFLALAMTVFMLSLSGFPPTAGFMGKFYLFKGAIDAGYLGLVIIAVLNSVVSAYYYLRVVVFMYMRESEEDAKIPATPILITIVLILCILGVLYMGILPNRVLHITQLALYY